MTYSLAECTEYCKLWAQVYSKVRVCIPVCTTVRTVHTAKREMISRLLFALLSYQEVNNSKNSEPQSTHNRQQATRKMKERKESFLFCTCDKKLGFEAFLEVCYPRTKKRTLYLFFLDIGISIKQDISRFYFYYVVISKVMGGPPPPSFFL